MGEAPGSCPQWLHHNPQYNIIVSGEAILSAENSGKPLGGRGSAPNPAGELTALRRPPSWWEGVAVHSQELHPRSLPSALRSCPNEKPWARP